MNECVAKQRKSKMLLVTAALCIPVLGGLGAAIGDKKGLIGGYIVGQAILTLALMKYRGLR